MGARRLRNEYNRNTEQTMYDDYSANDNYYVKGNTIRQTRPDPSIYDVPDHRQREEIERRQRSRTKSKPQKELSNINKGTCAILMVAIAMTLFICIDYIKVQADISTTNKNIIQTEKELADLKEDNRIQKEQLNASLDLNKVYNIATSRFGMVRPSEDNVIYFEATLSEYVKQYEEIPENTEASLINNILN